MGEACDYYARYCEKGVSGDSSRSHGDAPL